MVKCERCGDDAPQVWRHRDYEETMTHRTVAWLCRDCHPSVAATSPSSGSTEAAAGENGRRV